MSKNASMLALMIGAWASATSVPALAQSGTLDPTFGVGGRVLVLKYQIAPPGDGSYGAANAALQPDGRIVVAVSFDTFGVVRFLPNGQLDASFGTAGVVRDPGPAPNFNRAPQDLAIQPDGKIVVVGSAESTDAEHYFVALARFDPDGRLDATFGVGGNVHTPARQFSADTANVVLLQPDGKIVIGGISQPLTEHAPPPQAILQRYKPDGSLDASFGQGGKIVFSLPNGDITALALQTDGKILTNIGKPFVRVLPNGTIDPSHTPGTIASTAHTGPGALQPDAGGSGAFQPDGRYVVTNTVLDSGDVPQYITDEQTVRFMDDGALDSSFASPVVELTQFFPAGNGIALQADGKVLVGGVGVTPSNYSEFSLVRLDTDGRLDQGFGRSGRVNTAFNANDSMGVVPLSLLVQPDGRIVAVGVSLYEGLALARYLP